MRRKTIIADYQTNIDENNKKTFTYIGPKYQIEWTGKERKAFLAASWLMPIAAITLLVLMARLNTHSTRQMLVTLPFVGLFMPLVLLLSDAWKLAACKQDMTRTQYERGYAQQTRCVVAGLALISATLLADVIYLVSTPGAYSQAEGFFLAMGLAMAVLFAWFFYRKKQIKVLQNR